MNAKTKKHCRHTWNLVRVGPGKGFLVERCLRCRTIRPMFKLKPEQEQWIRDDMSSTAQESQ